MAIGILDSYFSKLFILLFSLLLLIFLTTDPVYADQGREVDRINMIRRHVEKIRYKYPWVDEKVRQIEEKERTGVSLKDCCYDCHKKEKIKGGSTLIK